MASYVANHIHVICPSGLLRSTNSFRMNLSLLVQRKVTKRKDTPISLPCGFPQHSPLPTGRPDSPSGLDMTNSGVLPAKKDFLVPTKGECFGKLRGEGLFPVKLAEDSFTGRVD
jgi:hypothetical protein